MVRPASDGKFHMRDLPAGEYFIAAVTQIDPDELLTSQWFERLVPASLKFSIAEGEKRVQDFAFSRWPVVRQTAATARRARRGFLACFGKALLLADEAAKRSGRGR